jgi:hypothetical protein
MMDDSDDWLDDQKKGPMNHHFKSIHYIDKDSTSAFRKATRKIGFAFALGGIFINLWLFIRSRGIKDVCYDQVGECVWEESYPKRYFLDGLTADPSCNFESFEGLDVSRCKGLSENTVTKILEHYVNIETLKMDGVGLESLPSSYNTHFKIQNISLTSNNITWFPSTFFNFSETEGEFHVDFEGNPVRKHFKMDSCNTSALPRWFYGDNLQAADGEFEFESLTLTGKGLGKGLGNDTIKEIEARGIKARTIRLKGCSG